jgi:hypothetical protein
MASCIAISLAPPPEIEPRQADQRRDAAEHDELRRLEKPGLRVGSGALPRERREVPVVSARSHPPS